jgi:DNA repair protein RAD5
LLTIFLVISERTYSLRRAVLHPSLVLSTSDNENSKVATTNGVVNVDDLVKYFVTGNDEEIPIFVEKALSNLENDDCAECPICLDVIQVAIILPECLHRWYVPSWGENWLLILDSCKDCILAFVANCEEKGEQSRCPTCGHGPLKVMFN